MISWWVVWLVIAVIMLVIEIVTTGLVTLWFAVGAIVAMIMDLCLRCSVYSADHSDGCCVHRELRSLHDLDKT